LALQILTVRAAGRKVVKPLNGTDDLFRCLALAVTFLLDPKYTRRFEQYGVAGRFVQTSVGAVRSNRNNPPSRIAGTENQQTGLRKSFVATLK